MGKPHQPPPRTQRPAPGPSPAPQLSLPSSSASPAPAYPARPPAPPNTLPLSVTQSPGPSVIPTAACAPVSLARSLTQHSTRDTGNANPRRLGASGDGLLAGVPGISTTELRSDLGQVTEPHLPRL